jgi:hypothetical protein
MDQQCVFCLETLKSTEAVLNPIGCSCSFPSHGPCLQTWFEQKNQYECPICHAVSIPNVVAQPPQQIVYVVRVRRPIYELVMADQQRCAAICCFGVMIWFVVLTTVSLLFKD